MARTLPPRPAARATPGAVGEAGYSPLIAALDAAAGTVVYRETNGESRTHAVRYASFDSSNPLAAALEDATYAPALDEAPKVDGDGTDSGPRAPTTRSARGSTRRCSTAS